MFDFEENLNLDTGPATIASDISIYYLDKNQKGDKDISFHEMPNGYRVITIGNFSDLHIYLIVTHTKFKIKKDSVNLLNENSFSSEIIFYDNNQNEISKYVEFYSPFISINSVKECKYGKDYDGFEFSYTNDNREKTLNQKIYCDLSFITNYAIDFDYYFPLKIEYIGMSEKNGRTAQERLGKGHEKLQQIQSINNTLGNSTSLLLYRPGKFESLNKTLQFSTIVNTLEASLISYFQTDDYNDKLLNFPQNKTELTDKLKEQTIKKILINIESPTNTALYSNKKQDILLSHKFEIKIR